MLLVANLGYEGALAAGEGRYALSPRARQAATRAGMLLGALGRVGDTVWLPGPPGSLRPATVPGLEPARFIHGALPGSWDGPVLAWGETRATADLGTGAGRAGRSGSSVLDALLAAPRPEPAVAAQANRKTGIIQLRNSFDCSLPGSGIARDPADLAGLVQDCRRIHGDGSRWVLKGEYAAAGRERVLGRCEETSDRGHLIAANELLRRHDACLFEPWLHRTGDFGCSLIVGPDRVRLAGVYRLLVSPRGGFQGVETALHYQETPGPVTADRFRRYLGPAEADRMARVTAGATEALRRNGYRGHVGIDFFRYLDADGTERLHPLGEINARLTFGLVAAVLAQRIGQSLGCVPGTVCRLWLGKEQELPGGRAVTLVSDDDNILPPVAITLIPPAP